MSEDKQHNESSGTKKAADPSEKMATASNENNKAGQNTSASSHKSVKKNETHHKKRQHKSGAAPWGLLALIIVAGCAAAGWYGYGVLQQTQQRITDIQQSQTALLAQTSDFENELNNRFRSMQDEQQKLNDYIEVLREKDQHLRKDWLLLESEYLIQLANYRLLFERDINTAMAALNAADDRLRDTGDPGLINVRKSLAEAVQSLKQIPQADLAGLSLTLSAINKDIDKLPLKTPDPKSKASQQKNDMEETKNVGAWSELPAAMWRDIKSLIVIRDHEAPIQPLLSPEERFFLIENLRLQIEQARLAMLSGQAKVYKERLNTAIGWIDEHFDKNLPITTSTLDTLNKVVNESIAPELPDIAYTYQALQNYRLAQQGSRLDSRQKTTNAPATKAKPQAKPVEKAPATKPVPDKAPAKNTVKEKDSVIDKPAEPETKTQPDAQTEPATTSKATGT